MADISPTVLIVDDDLDFATATADFARARGFMPSLARSLGQTRKIMERERSDLTLLDLSLPDGSSFELLDELAASERRRVATMTDQPTVESAARAMSLPVLDYLVKPLCPIQLDALLINASARARAPAIQPAMGGLVVGCAAMRGVIDELSRIAPTRASVLLAGESGTGKELVARALHEKSGRAGRFVAVNCGAIAPELLASHLFGHERGSFTGAASRHVGYFEQANGGTLFLDEVTEMPPSLQVYLLRVLETGRITRVGGTGHVAVDARVIAATNRDPVAAIDNGQLREDLFYRLADFIVTLPPLRERDDEVLLLSHLFVERLNEEHNLNKRLAPGAEHVLMQHTWPGNVRELRSVIQRSFLLSDDDMVRIHSLDRRVASSCQDPTTVTFKVGMSYAEVEREMLLKTLESYGHDKREAAKALGVSVRTIHNQLARLNSNQPMRN